MVRLHVKLSATPQKKMLLTALVKQRNNSYDSFLDRFATELFITGAPEDKTHSISLYYGLCHMHAAPG